MANDASNIIFDALGAFPLGMDSGKDAFLLTKDQLSLAVNATVRGDYITNRPPYQIQKLTYKSAIQQAVEKSLFQGACYFAPDTGGQMLVAQIGGRLFTFTPDTATTDIAVNEVSIPGDFNSSSIPQAWLEQAERWVIVDNGSANPIFIQDGVSSRRSVPTSNQIAITQIAGSGFYEFTTPVLNGTTVAIVTSTATIVNYINQAVQLIEYDLNGIQTANTTYEVVALGGAQTTYNMTLTNLGDTAGATQGVGTQMLIQQNNLGAIYFLGNIQVEPNDIVMEIVMLSPVPSFLIPGWPLTINGDSGWLVNQVTPTDATSYILRLVHHNNATPLPPIGSEVYANGISSTSVVAGTVNQSFVAPAINSTIDIILDGAFTYAVGQIVFLNGKQYQVSAYNPVFVGGTNAITLLNLNDSRLGHIFNNPTTNQATQIWNFPELPPGRMGTYGMGRVWKSLTDGISFMAGDIVGGPSGSPAFNFRDAVLKSSENEFIAGGGSFSVPSNLGQITGMQFTSQLDASLGQGPLMVITPGGIFSCNAPVDRSTWASMTNPILSESLIGLGGLSQNSSIVVNGDLIFRSVDGIRSLIMARRDFWSWGNTPISFEVSRILDTDNPTGLPFGSGVQTDNRMLMTTTPTQGSLGVYNQGLVALNFDPISSLQGKANSVWDGVWTGLNVLQILEGQFSGTHRSFAFTLNTVTGTIELYEILKTGNLDNGTSPITWSFETPFTFKEVQGKGFFDMMSIEDGEFYVEDISPGSSIHFRVQYRPDFSSCWYDWHEFDLCANPKNTTQVYGARLGLGRPPSLTSNTVNGTAANFGRWFQYRFFITGHCVWKGMKIMGANQPQPGFAKVLPKSCATSTP